MLQPNESDNRIFDMDAYQPKQPVELWEDNAGGLVITQQGETWGADMTNGADGGFADDAESMGTGEGFDNWIVDIVPVDRENSTLIATWEDGFIKRHGKAGANGNRYIIID